MFCFVCTVHRLLVASTLTVLFELTPHLSTFQHYQFTSLTHHPCLNNITRCIPAVNLLQWVRKCDVHFYSCPGTSICANARWPVECMSHTRQVFLGIIFLLFKQLTNCPVVCESHHMTGSCFAVLQVRFSQTCPSFCLFCLHIPTWLSTVFLFGSLVSILFFALLMNTDWIKLQ